MTNAISGSMVLADTAVNLVYTVPTACFWAEINVELINVTTKSMTVDLAISSSGGSSPNPDDYLEKGTPLATAISVSNERKAKPGSKIFAKGSVAGLVVQVTGLTITKR